MKKVLNPLSPVAREEPIQSVLRQIASQEGNDGYEYDLMIEAADYIDELEKRINQTEFIQEVER